MVTIAVDHEPILSGATCLATGHGLGSGPLILQRTDQGFVPAILRELASVEGRASLAAVLARDRTKGGHLKLFQPVHRTFHVALVELSCATFGNPRLDPTRIDGTGLVVRRVAPKSPTGFEGWMRSSRGVAGWVPFPDEAAMDLDPDPGRRVPGLRLGHPELDRRLAALHATEGPLAEAVAPLFVAPPEVANATGRTILFGLVPVTSAEFREEAPRAQPYELDEVRAHLSPFFKPGLTVALPDPGAEVDAARPDGLPKWMAFLNMLRQLDVEFGAFGSGPESRAMFEALDALVLDVGTPDERPAGRFLREAAEVLIRREGSDRSPPRRVRLPKGWPAIAPAQSERIVERAKAAMDRRVALVLPREGRFEDPEARYQLLAFARVRRPDGCPPRLAWGRPSEAFVIAPWFDKGTLPPPVIPLPDLDRDSVKGLAPGVTFRVPEALFNLLEQSSLKGMLDGKAGGGGIGLGWLCGFSIPIITLCAFIVLNLFLSLLDIVFWWMAFIKICLPIPVKKK